MNGESLGLIAALRVECQPILRWGGWAKVKSASSISLYHRDYRGLALRLAVSGMGGPRARRGLEALLEGFSPKMVISLGYGGAISPDLSVGDLVLGKQVAAFMEKEGRINHMRALAVPSQDLLDRLPESVAWRFGTLVTVGRLVDKECVRRAVNSLGTSVVVEMETFDLSEAIEETGISLVGLRAVSDEWGFDVAGVVSNWMDEGLQIRGSRVIRDLLFQPVKIGDVFRMFRRSRKASKSLGAFLRTILDRRLEM